MPKTRKQHKKKHHVVIDIDQQIVKQSKKLMKLQNYLELERKCLIRDNQELSQMAVMYLTSKQVYASRRSAFITKSKNYYEIAKQLEKLQKELGHIEEKNKL